MNGRLFCFYALCLACILYSCKQKNYRQYLNTTYIDSTIRPQDNFYLFANGRWIKNTTIPATESSVGSFYELYNKSKSSLQQIVEEVSAHKQKFGSIEQKIGDFYASGMDSVTIEKLGYDPAKPYLQKIDAIKNTADIMQFVAEQQVEYTSLLFEQSVGPDEKNSSINIVVYYQGGLGLPGRDYYFKTDTESLKTVRSYQTYLQTLFVLTGDDSLNAERKAGDVYELEKQLASSHRTKEELRNPQINYNKMAVAQLDKQMPAFAWKRTLSAMDVYADSVNVSQPGYYIKLNELLTTVNLETWKAYLRAHFLEEISFALSSPFVRARFNFWGRSMYGQQQMKPRWQRMVNITDVNLGDALGQIYIKKYFDSKARRHILDLVNNLQKAFEIRINKLDWMSDNTKQKAKEKLHALIKKIAYPDRWKDYRSVKIYRDKYFDNLVVCSKNIYRHEIEKVGKRVDKTEWMMTPAMVNAYYNASLNEIVFPAGVLQSPLFNPNADDAVNYGAIGTIIGHEMTHAFDDEGAQYDKDGNLKNWWTQEDSLRFSVKSKQVINLYNNFIVLDSIHVNGAFSAGENIADIGAVAVAYEAFKLTKQGKDTTKIDGFTPDQRFFISFAQVWRTKMKEQLIRQLLNIDTHSPPMFRVNASLTNFAPFYEAFHLQPGDKMYKPVNERIKIW